MVTVRDVMDRHADTDVDQRVAAALARVEPHNRDWFKLLSYTTRIEDAWVAITTITPLSDQHCCRACSLHRWHTVELRTFIHEDRRYWHCEIKRIGGGGNVFMGTGETAPLAISRAIILLGSLWKAEGAT